MIVDALKQFSPFMPKSMQSFVPGSHGFLLMSTFIYDLKRVCMFRLSTQEIVVIGLGGHKQGPREPCPDLLCNAKASVMQIPATRVPIRSRVGTVLTA